MLARRTVVWLVVASVLWCGTIAFAQNTAKPAPKPAPRASAPKTTARTPPSTSASPRSDPFIGVWRLNAGKSKYENGAAPNSFTRTYEDRGEGTIVMITDVNVQGTASRSYLVYKRDGKPYAEAAVGVDVIRLVTVRAIDRNTEGLEFIVSGKTVASGVTVTVSADGGTMTQVLSGKTAQGKTFTNTLVFDKQ